MSIDLQVKIGIDGADKPGAVASELDKMTAAEERAKEGAKRLTAEVSELAEMFGIEMAAGAAVGQATDKMAGFTLKQLKILEQINAPAKEWADQLKAIKGLLDAGALSSDQYAQQLTKLQRATGETNSVEAQAAIALERQAAALDRIHGPMLRYEQDLAALDALYKQDKISALEFEAELDRLNKKAGVSYGPNAALAGPSKAVAPAAGGAGEGGGLLGDTLQAVAPQLGQGGQLLGQFATGGLAAAAAAVALGAELIHISDTYTTLANKVERFATAGNSADDMLHEQLDLSRDLHSSLAGTVDLYVRVRESTTELNLSQRQQIDFAKDLGLAVAAQGRSAEDAASLMRRLSLAFETGAISGRELRSIMKEYPAIADGMSDSMGRTRAEMLLMASKGEISAQQIIESFHKMSAENQKTVDRMHETVTQKMGHLWDGINLSLGQAMSDDGPFEIMKAQLDRMRKEVLEQQRQMKQELEKNQRTGGIFDAAQSAGLNLGYFNKEQADEISNARAAAREFGFDVLDAFEGAKSKAQLYGTEIDKIRDQHGAKQIADDAKRIYESMNGVNDAMDAQANKWADLTSKANVLANVAAHWKLMMAEGVPLTPAQEQARRDADLGARNAATEQKDVQYGSTMVTYAQGLNTARAELEAFNRAQADGVIQGDAARQKYDALITTLNDGRLPAVIKTWEGFTLPLRDWREELGALTTLFESGRISLLKYTDETTRAAQAGAKYTHEQVEDLLMTDELRKRLQAQVHTALGGRVLVTPDAREAFDRAQEERHRRDAEERQAGKTGFAPSVTDTDTVRASLAALRTNVDDGSGEWKQLNDQLERAHALMAEFQAPATTLENALKDIDLSARLYALTQAEVNALQTRARDAYFQQSEALRVVKGPLAEYEATLRKLGHQADDNAISQQKYTDSVRAARIAFLEASGAAKEFGGAMEIEWIKLQQDADAFGASVAHLVVEDFGKLNDALVTAANGGEVAWGKMADSMIQDLERLALKMLEIKLIQSGIGLFGGAIGGGGGGGVAAADEMASAMGYANGGSFVVGGDGGTDTTPVAFRATRGETVTITPPGAYPSASGGYGGGSTAPVAAGRAPSVHIHNHYDSSVGLATIDSRQGNQTVLNVLRANQGTVRSYSGTRR